MVHCVDAWNSHSCRETVVNFILLVSLVLIFGVGFFLEKCRGDPKFSYKLAHFFMGGVSVKTIHSPYDCILAVVYFFFLICTQDQYDSYL